MKQDIEELETLTTKATRKSVKDVLTIQTHKLKTQLSNLLAEAANNPEKPAEKKTVKSKHYVKSIERYCKLNVFNASVLSFYSCLSK